MHRTAYQPLTGTRFLEHYYVTHQESTLCGQDVADLLDAIQPADPDVGLCPACSEIADGVRAGLIRPAPPRTAPPDPRGHREVPAEFRTGPHGTDPMRRGVRGATRHGSAPGG